MQHDLKLHGNHRLNLALNVDNLFDLKTITDYNQTINRDSLAFDNATFFGCNASGSSCTGFDPFALIAESTDIRTNPLVVGANNQISTKPYSSMGRRAFRFMAKYSF